MTPRARNGLSVPELIARKRDGETLSADELCAFIDGFTEGTVPDYQATAMAMAVYFQGMSFEETVALTLAMRDSGKTLRFRGLPGPIVDKHSTGGVGDKVTICLAPLVAACGAFVPKMSGRGLGHTGGTLDKLGAIDGFHVALSEGELRKQLRRVGCALFGQTDDLAPADRRLYALRDVTATVESIPLITASILSKKLAAGIDNLVLDVKVGRGAFMETEESARALARSLVRVGKLAGQRVAAVLTEMNDPLGTTIGNALEAAEAFALLHGEGPDDLREVTFALGTEMLTLSGVEKSKATARRTITNAIEDGSAASVMRSLVEAQGGDGRVVDEPDRLPKAKQRLVVRAPRGGYVRGVDARIIGVASMKLGAGRNRAEDPVDPAAGIQLHAVRGDEVQPGDPLATLHASRKSLATPVAADVEAAFQIGRSRPAAKSRIIGTLRR